MHILYLGDQSPGTTSAHRAAALNRLGHTITTIDPVQFLPNFSRLESWLHYRTGYRFVQKKILRSLASNIDHSTVKPDVIWVDSGEYFGPTIIAKLRLLLSAPIILFNLDDPTWTRDWKRFGSLRACLPIYDLCICVRSETQLEMLALGAPNVIRVWRSYDEIEHLTTDFDSTSIDYSQLHTSSVFVGTYIPGEKRDFFLLKLLESGLPVRIFGNGWQRSPSYRLLNRVLRGPSLSNRAYANILHAAGVCIGFLSCLNRDLHTTRTFEIPYAKGVLCAERTSEHQLLYQAGLEALFWDSWSDCLSHCRRILADPFFRDSLVKASHSRVLELGVGNEDICRQVLAAL